MKVACQNARHISGKMLSTTPSTSRSRSHFRSSSGKPQHEPTKPPSSQIIISRIVHRGVYRAHASSIIMNTLTYLIFTIFLLLIDIDQKQICEAVPSSSVSTVTLREVALKNLVGKSSGVANLTRQHNGDVFGSDGILTCNTDTCVGLSSGTAGLFVSDTKKPGTASKRIKTDMTSGSCTCRCLPYLPAYREDLGICVDDIHECTLSPFISGSTSEKIPFVFLPLRGQIVHPSREISFPGVRTPICAVTGSQYLSLQGWSELRNPIDTDFPFRLFRDEGRTFLRWVGEADLRQKMQGRLILVHLMCRDLALTSLFEKNPKGDGKLDDPNRGIFTPCVAFRINGSPVKYVNNVSEVLFQSETTANLASTSEGLSTKEYVVIGICSLLLGLIYVASVFLYLHVKRRKNQPSETSTSLGDLKHDINYPKNDQVTFGAPIARSGSVYSTNAPNAGHIANGQRQPSIQRVNGANGGNISNTNANIDEMGIVKSNPLLKHFQNLSDHSGFTSDRSNSASECDEKHQSVAERIKNMQTSALVHPMNDPGKSDVDRGIFETSASPTQENECLPEENVSIIEDMVNDEKLENMRAIVNGTVRKKLYFNPAYFEPHLLMSPPPAAIEFLTKIREVIAIAKYKMASKRFQPSLEYIPEEGQSSDVYVKAAQQRNQHYEGVTLRRGETAQAKCNGNHENQQSKCGNCGDKRNSIERWLEGVPVHNEDLNETSVDQPDESATKSGSPPRGGNITNQQEQNPLYPGYDTVNKQNATNLSVTPPTPSSTAPKIISHSLKPHVEYASRMEITQATNPMRSPTHEIYSQLARSGSEIYNNPRFSLSGSPHSSQKSKGRAQRKRMEVLDQYANPESAEKAHYDVLRSIKHMPDMVYEALAKDYTLKSFKSDKSGSNNYNIPTPDYDGTLNRSSKSVRSRDPTPDYSSTGRRSLRQYQPDSPIYRRRSPQYLIVDYETDSLERTATKKCSTSSFPSSDSSSQPSPSLSTALPLEEEIEVHHTVYDKVEGFRKDGDIKIKKKLGPSEYEEVKVSYRKLAPPSPRIKYDTPFRGSMTIEVEHDPASDADLSTDSDQFEPDTLDRKPKKISFGSRSNSVSSYYKPNGNAWSEHLQKSKNFVNGSDERVNYYSLENMTSLPDFSRKQNLSKPSSVQSSNSFHRSTESCYATPSRNDSDDQKLIKQTFGSLREIYQSKTQLQLQRPKTTNRGFDADGRLLTLEAKHSKRQRQDIKEAPKKIMPPDVVPAENGYYDIPVKLQTKIEDVIMPKNVKGWNTDETSGSKGRKAPPHKNKVTNGKHLSPGETDVGETETTSSNSESTEITGVSDTQANSESEHDKRGLLRRKSSSKIYEITESYRNGSLKKREDVRDQMRSPSRNGRANHQFEDIDKIEVLSTRSLSNKNVPLAKAGSPCRSSITESESSVASARFFPEGLNVQQVYRVEICPPTNGMQIAMGLRERDRSKKSKDLKNAWKKFVSLAASKFNGSGYDGGSGNHRNTDTLGKKSRLSDGLDRDEGISSLIDENSKIYDISYPIPIGSGSLGSKEQSRRDRYGIARSHSSYFDNRFGLYRQDLDSGYISGDSGECKSYSRRIYDRCYFRSVADKNHATGIDTIEDQTETSDTSSHKISTVKTNKGCGSKNCQQNNYTKETTSINNNCISNSNLNFNQPIQVDIYSSEDEQFSANSISASSTEDEGNTEEMCESGAESVETHSVLFKNIRNSHSNHKY